MTGQTSALIISIVSLLAALTVVGLAFTGYFSAPGPQGHVGPAGLPGSVGSTGAQGSIGPVGPAGKDAAPGVQGPPGAPGVQGPPGALGAPGSAGPAGASGLTAGDDIKADIIKVEVNSARKTVVTFRMSDSKGFILKVSDLDSPPKFGIAALEVDNKTGLSKYVNYVSSTLIGTTYKIKGITYQPSVAASLVGNFDSGGVISDSGDGVFVYTFNSSLPVGYDAKTTHMVGGVFTRGERVYFANPVYFFVPAGGSVTINRLVSTTATCNQCHDPLAKHEGTRGEVTLCPLCHNPSSKDPQSGNTIDFKVFVHKIHDASSLPSVKNGTLFTIGGKDKSGIIFPDDVRDCVKCHTGPQGDSWKTTPSRAACGSCHDNVNFVTGSGHPAGPQDSDVNCKLCHTSTMGQEFDFSIPGAHVIPKRSSQLPGVNFTILRVINTAPGQSPVVTFNIKDNKGTSFDPKTMTSLSFYLAGPTTDYNTRLSETNIQLNTNNFVALVNGDYQYTFENVIPSTAKGTYGIAIQGYKTYNLTSLPTYQNQIELINVKDVGFNKIVYVAVTDEIPVARRISVALKNCDTCHTKIDFIHDGVRQATELCVMCHNPTFMADPPAGSADGTLPTSLDFKSIIHKIHKGDDAISSVTVGPLTTGEKRFPGDLRNCLKCHVQGGSTLPLQAAVQGNTYSLNGKVVKTTAPITTVCASCHDYLDAVDHMNVMNLSTRESCTVCHSESREFAVSKVHQRP